MRGTRPTSQSIVIVGIDETSLQKLGPWPFSRATHARLLQQIDKARAIGFDLIFSHPSGDDKEFSEALGKSPPVVLAIAENYQGQVLQPVEMYKNVAKFGHIETELGSDGLVRRIQLHKFDVPVLAGAMTEAAGTHYLQDVEKKLSVPYINFYGPEFTFLYLSYDDVLSGKYDRDFFNERYVLIGSKSLALGDVHITPFSRKHPIPGVEIQATILNNILENSFLKELPWLEWILCLICFAMALWLWPNNSEAQNAIVSIVFGLCVCGMSVIFFNYHYFVNLALPLFVLAISYASHTVIWWLKITTGLIKEIKVLDKQLVDGVDKIFKTLPTPLSYVPSHGKQLKLTEGFHNHISHMHQAIQALTLQNGFINHLLSEETPPLILWQKDKGDIVLANQRFSILWETVINPGKREPKLDQFFDFINPILVTDKKADKNVALQNFEYGVIDRIFDIFTSSKGKKSYHRVVIHKVTDTILGFDGVLASFTDVTEIRELERLKGEIMNIVSHELKLPLTTIMGFAEMLSESLAGPEKEFATEIRDQSNRLAKMIEDFLDIARIESGKYLINRYPFDLLNVVHDAASGVSHSAASKSIEIFYDLPKKISPLLGDESLLTQAVLNLLDNAVKFSPQHTRVLLSVTEAVNHIILRVEDAGTGIDDSEKTRIFEKFMRGANQMKESGFGLGLSFVREVVEGHAGQISVDDSELGGAMFTVMLPKAV
jgi:CHASE2 domain-containing sensor protein/nitrogen-specific signal transduction histidine kinase